MRRVLTATIIALAIADTGCISKSKDEYPPPFLRDGAVVFARFDCRQANLLDVVEEIESGANSVLPSNSQITILLQIDASNPELKLTVRDIRTAPKPGSPFHSLNLPWLVTFDIRSAGIPEVLEATAKETGFRWDQDSSGKKFRLYDPAIAPAEGKETHAEIAGKPDLKARADELKGIVVTPHLEQEITPGSNVLWCNTFQLAWNELCDLTGGPIDMKSPPAMVPLLNKETASKEDLDPSSYVAMAGLASDGIYDKIRKELERKFKGQASPELPNATTQMDWVAYAYLFKELPFEWAFTRFHENLSFEGYHVDSFGISQLLDFQKDEVKMASQVAVLDYANNDDLIIELKTRAKDDRLILAKVPAQRSLGNTINMVERRITTVKPTQMIEMETLLVPVLNFEILREYSELCNHPIRTADKKVNGTGIAFAGQAIRFRLDERGAVLKSEAVAAGGETERNLVFDKPFLVLLKRNGAKNPYFALWVGNAELLVPARKKPLEK